MKTIYLHGSLGEQYGTEFRLAINRPAEAIEALGHQIEGFFSTIAQGSWTVWRDDESIDGDMLSVTMDHCNELHIVPALEGAKGGGKGVGKLILGVALIAVSVVTAGAAAGAGVGLFSGGAGLSSGFLGLTYGQIALIGGAVALGGVTALTTPVPSAGDIDKREDETTQKNGVLGGQGNTTEQGQAIAVPFGLIRTGSQVIQVGLYTEEMTPTDYVESNQVFDFTMTAGTRTDDSAIVYIGAGPELYAPITNNDPNFVLDDIIPPYGSMSKQVFREKAIAQIAEREVGGQLRLEVVIKYADMPLNFFDRIRITTLGDVEVSNYVTLSATLHNGTNFAVAPIPDGWTDGDGLGAIGIVGTSNARRFTQWSWDIGSSELTQGQEYLVYLEYTN